MFAVKILLYTPGIALILSMLTLITWKIFGDNPQLTSVVETVLYIALVPGFIVAVLIACPSLQWGMDLDASGIRLVRACASTPLSYDDVTFVQLGTLADQVVRKDAQPSRDQRVLIEYHPHGRFAVWLLLQEAERLFKTLRERCGHAASIDSQGEEIAPRKNREVGVRLLARKRLLSGSVLVVAGVFSLLLAVLGDNSADSQDYIKAEAIRWMIITQAPLMIIAGLSILRRRPKGKSSDRIKTGKMHRSNK